MLNRRRRRRTWSTRLATLTAAALLSGASLAADTASVAVTDWPEFHGPRRDNISQETGLLKEWPAGGPTLAWKATGTGGGYSSVSVVGGKIYTAGDDKNEGSSFVYCLNAADGSQVWKAKLGKTGGNYEGTRATPTVVGDTVYIISQWGDVVAYKTADGSELWRKNLNADMGGKMASGWGNSESAVVDGDRVIVTPGGKNGTMAALNKKTGEVLWRSTELTDAAAYMAPVVVDFGGVRQAITLTHESVASVAVADGKLLWRAARPGKTAVIPTPVVKVTGDTAHVFVTSGYGVGCDLLKVTAAGGTFKADRVYKNSAMVNHHGGVILLGDHVYGYSDGRGWTSVNLLTGENGFKDKDLTDKGTITYADGRFYLRGEKTGDVVLLEATPDKATERGRLKQPDRTKLNAWAHVVIANGRMYIKDQGTLYCYDVKAK